MPPVGGPVEGGPSGPESAGTADDAGGPTAAAPTGRPTWKDPLVLVVGALVLVPVVAAIVSALRNPWAPSNDWALIELQVRAVGTADTPLLGTWSRFGWDHPGPWPLWLLAGFYRLVPAEHGLLFAAGMVNLVALAGCVAMALRRPRAQALVLLVGLAALGARPRHRRGGRSVEPDPADPPLRALLPRVRRGCDRPAALDAGGGGRRGVVRRPGPHRLQPAGRPGRRHRRRPGVVEGAARSGRCCGRGRRRVGPGAVDAAGPPAAGRRASPVAGRGGAGRGVAAGGDRPGRRAGEPRDDRPLGCGRRRRRIGRRGQRGAVRERARSSAAPPGCSNRSACGSGASSSRPRSASTCSAARPPRRCCGCRWPSRAGCSSLAGCPP